MRFSVERKPLLAALNAASGVTAGRTTLPILKCVRMSAIGSMVSVTATDLDQIVSSQIASEVGVEGLAIVSLDGFLAWCGTVKGGIVEVSADDATVALRCGTSTVTVLRVPDDEWPEWGGGIIEDRDIDPAPTLDALAALAPAQSNKEARYYLNGIALRDGGLIATNGHTLHAAKLDLGGDVILPRQGVALMMKALAGRPEKARFGHTETMWRLTLPRLTLTGKLVDGTFPDTSRIKVSSDTPEIRFIAEDAEDALKIVTAGARRGTPVRLRAADGKCVVRYSSRDGYRDLREDVCGEAVFDCEGEGETYSDGAYLLNGLACIGGGEAVMQMGPVIGLRSAQDSLFPRNVFIQGIRG